MTSISQKRLGEINNQIDSLTKQMEQGRMFTGFNPYGDHKIRMLKAFKEVFKKYTEAGDNPAKLAEAKKFEAETIKELETKFHQEGQLVTAVDGSRDKQRINDDYQGRLEDLEKMRSQAQNEEKNNNDNNILTKLAMEFGGGANGGSKPGMDFGFWGTLFYGMSIVAKDKDGRYVAHPEIIPGVPETGKKLNQS